MRSVPGQPLVRPSASLLPASRVSSRYCRRAQTNSARRAQTNSARAHKRTRAAAHKRTRAAAHKRTRAAAHKRTRAAAHKRTRAAAHKRTRAAAHKRTRAAAHKRTRAVTPVRAVSSSSSRGIPGEGEKKRRPDLLGFQDDISGKGRVSIDQIVARVRSRCLLDDERRTRPPGRDGSISVQGAARWSCGSLTIRSFRAGRGRVRDAPRSPDVVRDGCVTHPNRGRISTLLAEHHRPGMSVSLCRSRGCGVPKIRARLRERGRWPWPSLNRRIPRWRGGLLCLRLHVVVVMARTLRISFLRRRARSTAPCCRPVCRRGCPCGRAARDRGC